MFPKAKLQDHTYSHPELGSLAISVMGLADGTRCANEIARELAVTVEDIEDVFDLLREEGLLDGWTAPPTSRSVTTRRGVIADLGRAAALFGSAVGAFSIAGSSAAFAGSSKELANKERKQKR